MLFLLKQYLNRKKSQTKNCFQMYADCEVISNIPKSILTQFQMEKYLKITIKN